MYIRQEDKDRITEEVKEKGLRNGRQEKDFTWQYVRKYCIKEKICNFQKGSAGKKWCAKYPEFEYRKKYTQVKEFIEE